MIEYPEIEYTYGDTVAYAQVKGTFPNRYFELPSDWYPPNPDCEDV